MSLGVFNLDLIKRRERYQRNCRYKILSFDLDPLYQICLLGVKFSDGDIGVPEAGHIKRIVPIEDVQCLSVGPAASEAELTCFTA
jgi:hypothetical protein